MGFDDVKFQNVEMQHKHLTKSSIFNLKPLGWSCFKCQFFPLAFHVKFDIFVGDALSSVLVHYNIALLDFIFFCAVLFFRTFLRLLPKNIINYSKMEPMLDFRYAFILTYLYWIIDCIVIFQSISYFLALVFFWWSIQSLIKKIYLRYVISHNHYALFLFFYQAVHISEG